MSWSLMGFKGLIFSFFKKKALLAYKFIENNYRNLLNALELFKAELEVLRSEMSFNTLATYFKSRTMSQICHVSGT